ncbi:MAG TPA: tRNA (N6-threonylcarbamoyladenosine(37)-N6)-methyltransferase TrmO [Methanomicrobiales archaeon]|nr:tRNA (N6-threonylcarbamoyladenosine(37)-N6)-methyltransferase TrmO [Methanomicrobiales archaeon]
MKEICYTPIGVLHTPFHEWSETTIQAAFSDTPGRAEILPQYGEGLKDLEGFSHITLLYHFHQAGGFALRERPFLDEGEGRGIFAIRHYRRPNPIGISTVQMMEIHGNIIEFKGADMLDNTPLLDIKPFVRAFDNRETAREGWVEKQRLKEISSEKATPKGLKGRNAGERPPGGVS